ncbi:mycofactocin-coupled SDR family oxidoreductase [Streptomyces sp. NBC_01754]|uniref:mycofactocin-coupled SDR family oxidoreductase n=1 Tax=Streptomyces sp. NBC_01754 TaxID=2975930 RepID=UPI002DD7A0EA|nr:mycofactocin-coupled SDR family oxidoreductase [Streptomyces sp. NBC_01754]WSC94337.1 mycofactocin-coupled SDR family oxidoreductase [Streptomyces sp. NBC_01754]
MGRVEDKVVVITGAARGQGRSHAVRLAEEGADIIALDICEDIEITEYPMASPEDLEETARLVRKTGRRAVTRQVDVRDRVALRGAIDEGVAELGRLDVVVANASILPIGPDRPIAAFTDTVDVNLFGAVNTVHAALPHLQPGASVIVIGSVAGLVGARGDSGPAGPGGTAYRFAKSVLVEYVETLALQLAPVGTRVNAVHPTNCNTDMLLNDATYRTFRPDVENPTREDAELGFKAYHAMPVPWIEPEEVSHAVAYLASEESRYVTGMQLKVDAGVLMKLGG